MIDSAAGERIAAPSPWTARAAISIPSEVESPQSERGGGEERDAGHEHAPPAEEVGRPAAEQQEAAEGRARTR